MEVLTDSFLSCSQTPVILEQEQLNTIKQEGTCTDACKVRITSLLGGTGATTVVPQGLSFLSPQTSLEFNGIRHTCQGCTLTFPAMHQLKLATLGMRYEDISGAELQIHFRGDTPKTIESRFCLVLPIRTGRDGVGKEFFEKLGFLQRSMPTLGSLLDGNTPLVLYKGTDTEGRLQSTATSRACSNSVPLVNYLLYLKPLIMRKADFTRFRKMVNGDALKASVPIPTAKLPLFSYIPKFRVITTTGKETPAPNGYVETAQVKCRPLDTARDIKGNKVYVGGPGTYRTLKDELQDASDLSKTVQAIPDATTDVSTIESILGAVLGVVLGIVLIALIVWFVFSKTELSYKLKSLQYVGARLKTGATGVSGK